MQTCPLESGSNWFLHPFFLFYHLTGKKWRNIDSNFLVSWQLKYWELIILLYCRFFFNKMISVPCVYPNQISARDVTFLWSSQFVLQISIYRSVSDLGDVIIYLLTLQPNFRLYISLDKTFPAISCVICQSRITFLILQSDSWALHINLFSN